MHTTPNYTVYLFMFQAGRTCVWIEIGLRYGAREREGERERTDD